MQGLERPVWAGSAGLDVCATPPASSGCSRTTCGCHRDGFAPLAWELVGEVLGPVLPDREPADPAAVLERFAAILRDAAPGDDGDPSMVVLGDDFETTRSGRSPTSRSAWASR